MHANQIGGTGDQSTDIQPIQKLLIVEDEETVRSAIEAGLEVIGGFTVFAATSADEGFDCLKEQKPEVLLLDLVMPVTDGMEFLRRMASDPEISKPDKVVLMTAMENPVPEENLQDFGIDLVLSKPFRLKELASAVGRQSPF